MLTKNTPPAYGLSPGPMMVACAREWSTAVASPQRPQWSAKHQALGVQVAAPRRPGGACSWQTGRNLPKHQSTQARASRLLPASGKGRHRPGRHCTMLADPSAGPEPAAAPWGLDKAGAAFTTHRQPICVAIQATQPTPLPSSHTSGSWSRYANSKAHFAPTKSTEQHAGVDLQLL